MTETSYLTERIKKLLYEMESIFVTIEKRNMFADFRDADSDREEDAEYDMTTWEYRESFREYASLVYKLVLNYVEQQGHPRYLEEIRTKLAPMLDTDQILEEYNNRFAEGPQNNFLHEVWAYLSAYELFGRNDIAHLMQRTGISYLETILHNTAVVIHHRNLVPKNETDVYKAVADICKAVFPGSAKPDTAFVKIAGEYKPDVLIPTLNCAVEYKYAKTEAKLKATLEGILADVQHYSGHPLYKIFYAVFYVQPDIWGAQKFSEVWKENNFPPNWKGIYVVG